MEHHLQTMTVGIAQDILIELHGLLLVATEEVNLDSLHTNALQPAHLLFAGNGGVHTVTWSLRGIVPETVTVVPHQQMHPLALSIFRKLGDTLTTDILVPPVIHQAVLKAHGRSQVDKAHLIIVVDRVVLTNQPAPGIAPRLIISRSLIAGLYYIIADGSLEDGFQIVTQGDGAPRCFAWQGDSGKIIAKAVVLALIGISHSVAAPRLIVAQMTTAVATSHTRLAHQCPTSRQMEQRWEDIAMTILRGLIHGSVVRITLLIRRFGLFPTGFRSYLRRDKGGGTLREVKTCQLRENAHALVFTTFDGLSRHLITESDVMVRNLEHDAELHTILVLHIDIQCICLILSGRSLGATHLIVRIDN